MITTEREDLRASGKKLKVMSSHFWFSAATAPKAALFPSEPDHCEIKPPLMKMNIGIETPLYLVAVSGPFDVPQNALSLKRSAKGRWRDGSLGL